VLFIYDIYSEKRNLIKKREIKIYAILNTNKLLRLMEVKFIKENLGFLYFKKILSFLTI